MSFKADEELDMLSWFMLEMIDYCERKPIMASFLLVQIFITGGTCVRMTTDWNWIRRWCSTYTQTVWMMYVLVIMASLAMLLTALVAKLSDDDEGARVLYNDGNKLFGQHIHHLIFITAFHYCCLGFDIYGYPFYPHMFKLFPSLLDLGLVESARVFERQATRHAVQKAWKMLVVDDRVWKPRFDQEVCIFCYYPFNYNEKILELACGHVFHRDCALDAVLTAPFNGCWVCKNPVIL